MEADLFLGTTAGWSKSWVLDPETQSVMYSESCKWIWTLCVIYEIHVQSRQAQNYFAQLCFRPIVGVEIREPHTDVFQVFQLIVGNSSQLSLIVLVLLNPVCLPLILSYLESWLM